MIKTSFVLEHLFAINVIQRLQIYSQVHILIPIIFIYDIIDDHHHFNNRLIKENKTTMLKIGT